MSTLVCHKYRSWMSRTEARHSRKFTSLHNGGSRSTDYFYCGWSDSHTRSLVVSYTRATFPLWASFFTFLWNVHTYVSSHDFPTSYRTPFIQNKSVQWTIPKNLFTFQSYPLLFEICQLWHVIGILLAIFWYAFSKW